MQKFTHFTTQASMVGRSMVGMGMARSAHDLPMQQHQQQPQHQSVKQRSNGHPSVCPPPAPDAIVDLSFNVPLNNSLGGPERDEVLYSSPGAFDRWVFKADDSMINEKGEPKRAHDLAVHHHNFDILKNVCLRLEQEHPEIESAVFGGTPRPVTNYVFRAPLEQYSSNVCLHGPYKLVMEARRTIMNSSPIHQQCLTVDINEDLIVDDDEKKVRLSVLNHLDDISRRCKVDIFLLHPKQIDDAASTTGVPDTNLDNRLRCQVYGDTESAEHAKMRVLVMVDQILHRHVDVLQLEVSLHTIIAGRGKKNIKLIEAATNTAIYFPPPFPHVHGYTPQGAARRQVDDIIITGEKLPDIRDAKTRLHEMVMGTKLFIKEVEVTQHKVDGIILERLDKMQKILETNGASILLPPLGTPQGIVRVQGLDILHVERTVRELMALASQFYKACWVVNPVENPPRPTPSHINGLLSDMCINSGAEMMCDGWTFHINGTDEAIKAALMVLNNVPLVSSSPGQLAVKIELATEHKEFVSGKKNGKINKIMSQSGVQIVFDGWNEYNFFIDVKGTQYNAIKNGLDMVEQEMPASISFHVPDSYHKRIIGIGGSHIQRIMKKYSVFVKFSNAQDRGNHYGNREDDEYFKMDNVICRTPARNAQNLDLVKQEIMDMVEAVDAEHVTEKIQVDRLYHRNLLAQMDRIEELETKWKCKVEFPSTEDASDFIKVTGPQFQIPQALDDFLKMIPQTRRFQFTAPDGLKAYLRSPEFQTEVVEKMLEQYVMHVRAEKPSERAEAQSTPADEPMSNVTLPTATLPDAKPEDGEVTAGEAAPGKDTECIVLNYTRNNGGGLEDAVQFLVGKLVSHGLTDTSGFHKTIARPQSDSFEDSLPYFDNKVLHPAEPPIGGTDSPTRAAFEQQMDGTADGQPGSFFSKFKTSLIGNRKNGNNSAGSLFKHTSSNVSRASLISTISMESQGSYRAWNNNDSAINLPEEDLHNGFAATVPHGAALNASTASLSSLSSMNWSGAMSPAAAARIDNKPFHGLAAVTSGDTTPTSRHDPRASINSIDSGRPSTSHSFHNGIGTSLSAMPPASSTANGSGNGNGSSNAGPGPIGPPR